MNQIEWCQVRLDITQEIQVTQRSKLPGDPSYPEIQASGKLPRDPALGNLPGDPVLGNLPRDPSWEIYPEIRHWEIIQIN